MHALLHWHMTVLQQQMYDRKKSSRKCGNCDACTRTEDCAQCDFCKVRSTPVELNFGFMSVSSFDFLSCDLNLDLLMI